MTDSSAPESLAERVADSLHEHLEKMVRSWGILDVGVDVDGHNVDAELLFTKGPDIGFTLDVAVGACRYCVLLDDETEQWLDADVTNIDLSAKAYDESLKRVLDGVLAARRPLLRLV